MAKERGETLRHRSKKTQATQRTPSLHARCKKKKRKGAHWAKKRRLKSPPTVSTILSLLPSCWHHFTDGMPREGGLATIGEKLCTNKKEVWERERVVPVTNSDTGDD